MRTAQQIANTVVWIEALRDPERLQARKELRSGDAMCCLGVACDVSNVGMWGGEYYSTNNGRVISGSFPPSTVYDYFGLTKYTASNFANLNDKEQYTFVQIADVVEKWNTQEGKWPSGVPTEQEYEL